MLGPWAIPRGDLRIAVVVVTALALPGAAATARDCNRNGVDDSRDIADGVSRDCNRNGAPDECDIAPVNVRYDQAAFTVLPTPKLNGLILTDMTGDGLLDAVSSTVDLGVLWLVDGHGVGDFFEPRMVPYGAAGPAMALIAADLDGNGRPDLVVSSLSAGERASRISVFFNRGGGVIDPPKDFATPGEDYPTLAAADLDGDHDIDIVSSDLKTSTIFVRLNQDSQGTLELAGQYATPSAPFAIVPSDFDGDGDVDLAIAAYYAGKVSILRNQGDATFGAPEDHATGSLPRLLVPADLDADGDVDLAVGNGSEEGARILVLSNDGRGDFSRTRTQALDSGLIDLEAADLDGDGGADLVALNFTEAWCWPPSKIQVVVNRGDGRFLTPLLFDVIGQPAAIDVADLNGDGLPEIAYAGAFPDPNTSSITSLLAARGNLAEDANHDGVPDSCELEGHDCNANGSLDAADIERGTSPDCDGDGVPDDCEPDCNGNHVADSCELASEASHDMDGSGVPDECESPAADCNLNETSDAVDIATQTSQDCNRDHLPDECELSPLFRFSAMNENKDLCGCWGAATLIDLDGEGPLVSTTERGPCTTGAGSVWILLDKGRKPILAGNYSVDAAPRVILPADVNGDAAVDLLVIQASGWRTGPQAAALFRGSGASFHGRSNVSLAGEPAGAVVADFDGDGDLDFSVANEDPLERCAALFVNDGRGTFSAGGDLGPVGGARSIVTGDWNRDGNADIALVRAEPEGLLLFYGGAGGALARAVEADAGPFPPLLVAAGDLDADGALDLVLASAGAPQAATAHVTVRLQDGSGGFAGPAPFESSVLPASIIIGDVHGTGFADVAVLGPEINAPEGTMPGGIYFLLNDGHGALQAGEHIPLESQPVAAQAGDIDRDGDLDLLVASANRLDVFPNQGHGRFQTRFRYRVGEGSRNVVAADFDGDEDNDLATASRGLDFRAGNVVLLVNDGGAHTFSGRWLTAGVPDPPKSISAGDFDGDHDIDLAVAGGFSIRVLLNGGRGELLPGQSVAAGSNPFALIAADFDNDGDLDFSSGNSLGTELVDNVSIYLNDGAGAFGPPRSYSAGKRTESLSAADLDGDGHTDLVAVNFGSLDVSIFHNSGAGLFVPAGKISLEGSPYAVHAVDLDVDGHMDLLVSSSGGLAWLRGKIGGGFLGSIPIGTLEPYGFSAADFDGDGKLDPAVAYPGYLTVYRRASSGESFWPVDFQLDPDWRPFFPPSPAPAGQGASGSSGFPGAASLAASDLDGDGDLDLAIGFSVPGSVTIAFNETSRIDPDANGNSILDSCEVPAPPEFRRGDPNQDARVDVSDAVVVLRHLFFTGEALACRKAADSNDDGRVDLSDAVAVLNFLFLGADALPAPFPGCGTDATPDGIECERPAGC
jgi:hypothetical protein